jgi:alkanesulfonate monooxygenase SsuD/methylene tetrahydromethanopterin reductase-like flavin-dependent oxidoreductase (luciferase family)
MSRPSAPLRVGLKLSQDVSMDAMRAFWRIADEARFDHCWAFDHMATIGPIGDDHSVYDGWTLLAAMAALTSHVRIGLLVTGVTYRNPALLAKIAVTVDHLSAGRLEFGIGAAWATNEHEMFGISGLDHRVGVLSESLQAIKRLWTEERIDLEGRYIRMKNAVASPKPVQKPHPPIWIGASGPSTIRLAARHADVWNVTGGADRSRASEVAELSSRLDDACRAIGRDPNAIRRSAQFTYTDPAELIETLGRWYAMGFSELVVMCGASGLSAGTADPLRAADVVATKVLPEMRSLAR